ncbi:coiled-coil domain-containing protein 12-like [Corticium candelabrum]|uniref:coiled-coil domain-containing protein 12-like n=1 Tax=Corticium candelabrum TaxID=121492 RepID=UPI002E26153D|nr:coiled-coil domain-containing protein 12-like [Corticium candelabrum]
MSSDLESAALERKAKLQALRKKRETETSDIEGDSKRVKEDVGGVSGSDRPILKFRNYKPKDETLQNLQMPRAKPESVDEQIEQHLNAAKEKESSKEVNLLSLAPRKPDWDLKRDVAKKLEKLERRTQRAIVELIRERLATGDVNLADVVASSTETENWNADQYD